MDFMNLWMGFVGLVIVAWISFLIWGGVQLIDILRNWAA